MNDQQKTEQNSGVRDQQIRAALDQHWAASDANDFETEHCVYHEDAVLEYPQSGERTRGRVLCGSIRGSGMARSMGRTDGNIVSRPRDIGDRYSTSSDGGTRDGLETVSPVCAAG
jgi:hypothetical protein